MADFVAEKLGRRFYRLEFECPNNGGQVTIEANDLPYNILTEKNPITPVVAFVPHNAEGVDWHWTATGFAPDGYSITFTFTNATPGLGESGFYTLSVWFPHSRVR